jgi:DNA-binding CsgD family transcriptional regulator
VAVEKVLTPSKQILSEREKEVLRHIMSGKKNSEIATLLFISENTVKNHRKNILSKTGTSSIAELISKAIKEGWV